MAGGFLRYLPTFWNQSLPPKPKFSLDQIPDLTGRICIVTGGNGGVGYEMVKALLQHNAKVYIASRNKARLEVAIENLKKDTGKTAFSLVLDLSSLASVRRAAQEFMSKEKELHVLFNNAGVMFPPIQQLTADGYDLQFGTNVLGHFYFTELLLSALVEGQKTSPDGYARVITTSSSATYLYTIDWNAFVDGPARKKLGSQNLYSQSKFANAVVAYQAAQRYENKGILSMSCNPGNLKSDLQRHMPPLVRFLVRALLLYPTPYGALTPLWGGLMPETIQYNGQFLIPWARIGRTREEAYDTELGERLWTWLQEQVDKFEAVSKSA